MSASTAHLDAFAIGGIVALHRAGYSLREIVECEAVDKPDGSVLSFGLVGQVTRGSEQEPTWRGERAEEAMVRTVLDRRGKEKMTSGKVKRRAAQKVSSRTVRRRLREAGLRWLRRRRRTWVPEPSREMRLEWVRRVKKSSKKFLRRWVYTDGISFYLDRTEADAKEKARAALGLNVWRYTELRDALFKDCVGASAYSKAQGQQVRVGGMLARGHLHIRVMEAKTVMNRWRYKRLIRTWFPKWLHGCFRPLLVQDYERCLWCAEPQQALKDIGVEVLQWHPKHSPDLNAIENAWKLLRDRLADTQPTERESRCAFVRRLRAACTWVNGHHGEALSRLSRNQKIRAKDVKANDGYRTQW